MPPRRRPLRPSSAAEAVVERIDSSPAGAPTEAVTTGFPSLDRLLGGGFRRQDLVMLGGDVGSGKSSFALAIALRCAEAGIPVTYLSGEMSESRLMERALALQARVRVDALRGGELDEVSRATVGAAALRLRDLPLRIRPLPGQQFTEVADSVDDSPPQGLVVVDDLQLAGSPAEAASAEDRAAATVRALKGLALTANVAVLALAQLPRFRAGRRDPRPTLDDFGAHGVVKQVADVVLSIYREEMYRPGAGMEGAVELIVGKNRNGPTGYLDLYFYSHWLRFEDMLDPDR